MVPLGIFVIVVVISKLAESKQGENENLDFVYSPSQVAKKSGKTLKLLEFLVAAGSDDGPGSLAETGGDDVPEASAVLGGAHPTSRCGRC